MPRQLTSGMLAALSQPVIRPALFCQLTFLNPSTLLPDPMYLWTGYGTVSWNGVNWAGIGSFGSVSVIEEGANIQARGITLTLSGIDPSLLAGALQDACQELPVILWLALYDSSSVMIPSPCIIWSGQADQPTITVGAETATISLTCESRLLEMNVEAGGYRRDQDTQQLVAPGDTSMNWVNGIQEQAIIWGQLPISGQNI